MSVLGAIGGAVASMVGSAGQGLIQGHIQNFFDRHMMNHQYHLNLDAWNKQNAYNTPSAQMARYAEAGLNPNLIYGQANTAGSIASPSATSKPLNLALGAQIENLKADNANKHKQNTLLQSQADYVDEQTRGVKLENLLKAVAFESLRGKNPLDSNPNDPYWYRDIKKVLGYLWTKSMSDSAGGKATPTDIGPTFWSLLLNPRGVLDKRGKLVVQGDR